jgi:hypothetical protein
MTEPLYTRVSPDFDPTAFHGILVASPRLEDTYGFTELGHDTAEYDTAPTVLEVTPLVDAFASVADVEAAAERAGIVLWMDFDTYMSEWPGATAEAFEERAYPAIEDNNANQLLSRPEVVRELESAGYKAFRGHITVGNTQPEVTCFWDPASFGTSGPVPLAQTDPDSPYQVELAPAPAPAP